MDKNKLMFLCLAGLTTASCKVGVPAPEVPTTHFFLSDVVTAKNLDGARIQIAWPDVSAEVSEQIDSYIVYESQSIGFNPVCVTSAQSEKSCIQLSLPEYKTKSYVVRVRGISGKDIASFSEVSATTHKGGELAYQVSDSQVKILISGSPIVSSAGGVDVVQSWKAEVYCSSSGTWISADMQNPQTGPDTDFTKTALLVPSKCSGGSYTKIRSKIINSVSGEDSNLQELPIPQGTLAYTVPDPAEPAKLQQYFGNDVDNRVQITCPAGKRIAIKAKTASRVLTESIFGNADGTSSLVCDQSGQLSVNFNPSYEFPSAPSANDPAPVAVTIEARVSQNGNLGIPFTVSGFIIESAVRAYLKHLIVTDSGADTLESTTPGGYDAGNHYYTNFTGVTDSTLIGYHGFVRDMKYYNLWNNIKFFYAMGSNVNFANNSTPPVGLSSDNTQAPHCNFGYDDEYNYYGYSCDAAYDANSQEIFSLVNSKPWSTVVIGRDKTDPYITGCDVYSYAGSNPIFPNNYGLKNYYGFTGSDGPRLINYFNTGNLRFYRETYYATNLIRGGVRYDLVDLTGNTNTSPTTTCQQIQSGDRINPGNRISSYWSYYDNGPNPGLGLALSLFNDVWTIGNSNNAVPANYVMYDDVGYATVTANFKYIAPTSQREPLVTYIATNDYVARRTMMQVLNSDYGLSHLDAAGNYRTFGYYDRVHQNASNSSRVTVADYNVGGGAVGTDFVLVTADVTDGAIEKIRKSAICRLGALVGYTMQYEGAPAVGTSSTSGACSGL